MKAIAQPFTVVVYTILYKLVPIFESVDEIPKCDHISCEAELTCGTVYYVFLKNTMTFSKACFVAS